MAIRGVPTVEAMQEAGDPLRPQQRRFLLACGAGAAVALSFAWITLDDSVTESVKAGATEYGLIALAVWMTLASRAVARRSVGRTRLAWTLMTLTGALRIVAESLWWWMEHVVVDYEDPSIADGFYLAAVATGVAAILMFFPAERLRSERLRNLIAASVIGLSVLFLSRALVLPTVLDSLEGTFAARAVYVAYPICDVVLGSLALILLSRVKNDARLHVSLLAGAFMSDVVADTAYGFEAALGEYSSGQFADIGWILAYVLFVLAALAPRAGQTTELAAGRGSERPDGLASLVIYVPLLAAVFVAAWNGAASRDGILLSIGIAVLILFGLRQYLLARDTTNLIQALQRVHELEEASDALRRVAGRSERTMQAVAEGVFGVDSAGRITFANPPAGLMLGHDAASLVGRNVYELFYARDPDVAHALAAECVVRRSMRLRTPVQSADETFVRGDGSTFPVELAVGPVVERGVVVAAVVVFRDVSQRKEIERLKDEFISVVSHELRTPLTAIRGSLGLLASGKVDPLPTRSLRLVTLALDSSVRLARLVDDLLDIDRIESGAATIELSRCEVEDLVGAAVDGVSGLAAAVPVKIQLGPVAGCVHAEGDRIIQTLTNLLGNAIKFSPPATTITIGATPREDFVEFVVADEGRGIPAGKREKIFERFEQVDSSDTREKGGTGLGLSICRSIVRRHGGRIWVTSELGSGSTFFFTIPVARERSDDLDSLTSAGYADLASALEVPFGGSPPGDRSPSGAGVDVGGSVQTLPELTH